MAAKSVGEAVTQELAGKAIIWGPVIAGGLILGPVGALLGVLTSVVIVASGSGNSPPKDEAGDAAGRG